MGKIRGREGAKSKTVGKRTSKVSETLINKYLNAKDKEKDLLLRIIKRVDPDFKG